MNISELKNLQPGDLVRVDGLVYEVTDKMCCPIPADGFFYWLRNGKGGRIHVYPADAHRVEIKLSLKHFYLYYRRCSMAPKRALVCARQQASQTSL